MLLLQCSSTSLLVVACHLCFDEAADLAHFLQRSDKLRKDGNYREAIQVGFHVSLCILVAPALVKARVSLALRCLRREAVTCETRNFSEN